MSILSLAAAALGLCVAFLVGRNAVRIGTALGVLDHPDGARKIHARATPLVGGFAIAAAAVPAALLTAWVTGDHRLAGLGVAVLAMFAIGAFDDRRHLAPTLRLGAALIALGVLVALEPDFAVTELRFSGVAAYWPLPGAIGVGFTLLCLVGLLNAINMADGKNGIVIGFGLVWTGVLAAYAPPVLWPVLAAAGAALAVLLAFNLRGRLFLGDGGSYALSALYGLSAIFVYNVSGSMMADNVALLFAIPVFDTVRLMAVRAAGGRSPMQGDRDHLHHHLYARIGWPMGLVVYLALVAVPNFAASALPGTGVLWLVVSLLGYALVMAMTRYAPDEGRPAE
jgi:UDP-GlcNAc:undecaprenyl-phosphate GlcNAc-1-phosphate transferase